MKENGLSDSSRDNNSTVQLYVSLGQKGCPFVITSAGDPLNPVLCQEHMGFQFGLDLFK